MKKIVMILILAVVLGLLVGGCTTTNQAMLRANNTFVGKNVDEFVLKHGIPYRKHQLNSGDFIYVWNSGIISYAMPATTTVTGTSTPSMAIVRRPQLMAVGKLGCFVKCKFIQRQKER